MQSTNHHVRFRWPGSAKPVFPRLGRGSRRAHPPADFRHVTGAAGRFPRHVVSWRLPVEMETAERQRAEDGRRGWAARMGGEDGRPKEPRCRKRREKAARSSARLSAPRSPRSPREPRIRFRGGATRAIRMTLQRASMCARFA
jgi:hypothetical protein